jgi:predicted amino acid-binding ACT domain protein
MKDQALRVDYFVVTTDDKPGIGADLHKKLSKEGVNLLAVLAFPTGGKIQVDLVPENPEAFTKAAKKLGITTSPAKAAFLIQGTDRTGAIGEILDRLGTAGINVTATCGVTAGGSRYGSLIWVEPAKVEAAARALGAQLAAHHV